MMQASQDITMADRPPKLQTFEDCRGRLLRLATRMVGNREQAQDVVQDCYLRWHAADSAPLHSCEAWLVAVVTRLCIDRLRHARLEAEWANGPVLAPLQPCEPATPEQIAEQMSALRAALQIIAQRLTPAEGAALLLLEVFELDYRELAELMRKSEAACRQVVHRARLRLRDRGPEHVPSVAPAGFEDFMHAIRSADRRAMIAALQRRSMIDSPLPSIAAVQRQMMAIGRARLRPVQAIGGPQALLVFDGVVLALLPASVCRSADGEGGTDAVSELAF
jgi:RNA polymerase sigma factor (sigma-70 family)